MYFHVFLGLKYEDKNYVYNGDNKKIGGEIVSGFFFIYLSNLSNTYYYICILLSLKTVP